jgi:hypothetical protein
VNHGLRVSVHIVEDDHNVGESRGAVQEQIVRSSDLKARNISVWVKRTLMQGHRPRLCSPSGASLHEGSSC